MPGWCRAGQLWGQLPASGGGHPSQGAAPVHEELTLLHGGPAHAALTWHVCAGRRILNEWRRPRGNGDGGGERVALGRLTRFGNAPPLG